MSGNELMVADEAMTAMDATSAASQANQSINPFVSMGYQMLPGVGSQQAQMLAEQTGDFGMEGLLKTQAAAASPSALRGMGLNVAPQVMQLTQPRPGPSPAGMRKGSFQPSANPLAEMALMRKRKPISLL